MDDNKKIEKLEKELSTIKERYNSLLGEFEKIFKYYDEGYKIAAKTLVSIKMRDLYPEGYISNLLEKTEEYSKKIRENALDGEIEFEEIRQDAFLSNYKEAHRDSEKENESIKRINENLIYVDIQSRYDEIITLINKLNIPENSVIVKKNLNSGNWKVFTSDGSQIIYEGQVNYKT